MTQPAMAGEPVPDDESLALEAAAVAAVVGPAAAAVTAAFAVAYVAVAGASVTGAALGAAIAHRLRRLSWPDMSARLPVHLDTATRHGVRSAVSSLPPGQRPDEIARTPSDNFPDLDAMVRDKVSEAADIAAGMSVTSRTDVDRIAGRARSGVARAQGSVRYAVNDRINSGTADVARAVGQRLVWVSERNACLDCLAYAGWVTEPDGEFPPGLTFDPAGSRVRPHGPLLWPPLHPNCRCRVRLYTGPAGPPPGNRSLVDPAARLYAEARRSVVYQWTDYASGPAMRRAAAALLASGPGLADSVEKRARAALRAGRTVPKGRR